MQYRPYYGGSSYIWWRSIYPDCVRKYWLPPDLFDHLIAGVYDHFTVVTGTLFATREYDTENEAYADLQQAAQALCASQHRPTQYRNPF